MKVCALVLASAIPALSPAVGSAISRDAREDVQAAVKKLEEAPNYSWTASYQNVARNGVVTVEHEGKAEKDGVTWIAGRNANAATEGAFKGDVWVVKTADGWKGSADPAPEGGKPNLALFSANWLRTNKGTLARAGRLAEQVKDMKSEGNGVYSGDLTEEGVTSTFDRGLAGEKVADGKASVKFWVKNGVLTKYEVKASGKRILKTTETPSNFIRSVEFKDVGTTKIDVPAEAKAKLG
jgi:hypothetical protein